MFYVRYWYILLFIILFIPLCKYLPLPPSTRGEAPRPRPTPPPSWWAREGAEAWRGPHLPPVGGDRGDPAHLKPRPQSRWGPDLYAA